MGEIEPRRGFRRREGRYIINLEPECQSVEQSLWRFEDLFVFLAIERRTATRPALNLFPNRDSDSRRFDLIASRANGTEISLQGKFPCASVRRKSSTSSDSSSIARITPGSPKFTMGKLFSSGSAGNRTSCSGMDARDAERFPG